MTLLKDLVTKIQDSSQWAIYAGSTDPDADARYGQRQFENGGLLDDKKYIIDGEGANLALMEYTEGDPGWLDKYSDREDFVLWLKDEGFI